MKADGLSPVSPSSNSGWSLGEPPLPPPVGLRMSISSSLPPPEAPPATASSKSPRESSKSSSSPPGPPEPVSADGQGSCSPTVTPPPPAPPDEPWLPEDSDDPCEPWLPDEPEEPEGGCGREGGWGMAQAASSMASEAASSPRGRITTRSRWIRSHTAI